MESRNNHADPQPVNISEFANYWREMTNLELNFKNNTQSEERDRLIEVMGVPNSTIEELENGCSPETLSIPEYDGKDASRTMTSTEAVPLATVRHQLEDLEKREVANYKHGRYQRMKYRLLDSFLTHGKSNETIPEEFTVKPGELILQVAIFRPKKPHEKRKTRYQADHSFRVLGSRCLSDLRDEIRCPSDLVVPGDFSNTPDLTTDICAKDLYKSAFFFINGVFYNDMRNCEAIDYSEPIRMWAEVNHVASFTSRDMASTNFSDLTLNLGVPYLYMHQGDCEHIIVFTELRMVHPTDELDVRNYPQMVVRSARCRSLCHACQNNTARWITYNDELAPESPCYFCDKCFKSFHYNEQKQKVCNFEAYKYFHGHVVT